MCKHLAQETLDSLRNSESTQGCLRMRSVGARNRG